MKKELTGKQIKWLIVVCILISFVTNFNDFVDGIKDGWNGSVAIEKNE